MKRISTLLLLALLLANNLPAQHIEKKWMNKADSVYGYYTVLVPASGRVQGALLLLDGFGGNAGSFFSDTKIQNVAWVNDLLVVGVPNGNRLYLDQSMTEILNRIAKETMQAYHLRKDQFAIGGMSSGGTIAIRYAELCTEKPAQFPIQPKVVFDVDSPLDLAGLYKSSETDIRKNTGGWWTGESNMIIDRLKKEIGDPYTDLEKYQAYSPFTRESKDSVNEKHLAKLAFRTYHDVDINWFIQNRNRSLYQTNMLDGSELVSRLVLLGSKQAEFIASKIPGRRSDGTRHPHSWNIVDEIDLVQWIKEKLNFYPDHISPAYNYTAPDGWEKEIILFPMDFAQGITYKGFEHLWFAPGWGDEKSPEKWAYTLLWWLDDNYSFTEKIINDNLENYFSGLTRQRAVTDSLLKAAWFPAKAKSKKMATAKGDKETYTATVSIFDAQVTRKPGNLYFKIHVKECADNGRTIVLLEASGYPLDQPVWLKLDGINENFQCRKVTRIDNR